MGIVGVRFCLTLLHSLRPSRTQTDHELHLSSKIYNMYFRQIYTTSNLYLHNLNIFYQNLV
jgi:hypothetical protein